MASDWKLLKFGSIANLANKRFDPIKEKTPRICIGLEHISKQTGRLLSSTPSNLQVSKKTIFHKGNVLFGRLRPELRKYIYCDFEGVCSAELWVLISKEDIDSKFLFYLVQQEKFIAYACAVRKSGMPRADWDYICTIPFPVPPLPEQKAIASMLEQWEAAIEKTEALIAAKERQFAWLVSHLIGQQQYASNWKKATFGELFKMYTGRPKTSTITSKGERFIVDMGSVSTTGRLIAFKRTNCISDMMQMHDLIMPNDDIGGGNIIGRVAIIEHANKYICGDHVYRLVQKTNHDPYFLVFAINSYPINRNLRSCAHGTFQVGLTRRDIMGQALRIPSMREQKRIAKILHTAQQEIELLEQQTKQYQTQKRGLIEKLLTGAWRRSN